MGDKTKGLIHKYNIERTDGKPVGDAVVLEARDPNTTIGILAFAHRVGLEGYILLANDLEAKVEAILENRVTDQAAIAKDAKGLAMALHAVLCYADENATIEVLQELLDWVAFDSAGADMPRLGIKVTEARVALLNAEPDDQAQD